MGIEKTPQIADLHAARGIAAVLVMFHHVSLVLQTDHTIRVSIDAILNAHGAVIFFFVLSGYVLSASLERSGVTRRSVMQFFARRAFRIYPAVIAAFVCAALIWALGDPATYADKTDWYVRNATKFYSMELSAFEVIKNIIPLSFAANTPTWSIYVELLGSILIPVIFVWFRKGTAFLVGGMVILTLFSALLAGKSGGFHYLNFFVFFAMGALVQQLKPLATLRRVPLQMIAIFAVIALLLCRAVYKYLVFGEMSSIVVHNADWNMSMLEGLFATLIVASLAAPAWRDNAVRLPKAMGDYSYSIYLFHFPFIYLAVWLTNEVAFLDHPTASLGLLYLGVPVVTLLVSALAFNWIERPAIRRGHMVAAKIGQASESAACNGLRSA